MDVRKIVINTDWGGFDLSDEAIEHYARLKGLNLIRDQGKWCTYWYLNQVDDDHHWNERDIPRDDPHLVATVEALGQRANGFSATLKVVEIPADVEWEIGEYDGVEWVAEQHRRWS